MKIVIYSYSVDIIVAIFVMSEFYVAYYICVSSRNNKHSNAAIYTIIVACSNVAHAQNLGSIP